MTPSEVSKRKKDNVYFYGSIYGHQTLFWRFSHKMDDLPGLEGKFLGSTQKSGA